MSSLARFLTCLTLILTCVFKNCSAFQVTKFSQSTISELLCCEIDRRKANLAILGFSLCWPLTAQAVDVKVTPLAHTFVTSSGSPKPLRENDATRYMTNAKVVFLFGPSDLAESVLHLVVKRKAEQGPGVTPGMIQVASVVKGWYPDSKPLSSNQDVITMAKSLTDGGTLIVGPVESRGVEADGKLVAECAQALGLEVGGAKSGTVLSVLLDGPQQGLQMEQAGYPVSTILWYSI